VGSTPQQWLVIRSWVDTRDFSGLALKTQKGLSRFERLSPMSNNGVLHLRMLNRVLTTHIHTHTHTERERVGERYANDLGLIAWSGIRSFDSLIGQSLLQEPMPRLIYQGQWFYKEAWLLGGSRVSYPSLTVGRTRCHTSSLILAESSEPSITSSARA
jgi:hypothetical protein